MGQYGDREASGGNSRNSGGQRSIVFMFATYMAVGGTVGGVFGSILQTAQAPLGVTQLASESTPGSEYPAWKRSWSNWSGRVPPPQFLVARPTPAPQPQPPTASSPWIAGTESYLAQIFAKLPGAFAGVIAGSVVGGCGSALNLLWGGLLSRRRKRKNKKPKSS